MNAFVAPARGLGRSMMGKLASSLFLTLVRAPIPARGAPFTIHRHIIVASTAMRSATPRFMEMAGGADKTFSSHPAGIAGRVKRVRLPAIEGLRGKGVLPSTRLRRFARFPCTRAWTQSGPHRGAEQASACQVITGKISDVEVPRSELSCSTLPPICRAKAAMSFNPEPVGFGPVIPRPLSDTVKRPSP